MGTYEYQLHQLSMGHGGYDFLNQLCIYYKNSLYFISFFFIVKSVGFHQNHLVTLPMGIKMGKMVTTLYPLLEESTVLKPLQMGTTPVGTTVPMEQVSLNQCE